MIRWLIALGTCLLGIIVVGAAVFYWRGRVAANATAMAFQMTRAALDKAEYSRALLIINSRPATDKVTDLRRWADFETECSVKMGLLDRLESIHAFHPGAVLANEDACVMLARTAMHLERPELADQFADAWRNKTRRAHLWICFDADRLMLNEKPEMARNKLTSVEFEGVDDCGRLVRLAMLAGKDDYQAAWNHLASAYQKNPRNAEVRLYRGQILEQAGQTGFARLEFEAAHFANTNNPIFLDTLAEFYRRQGNTAGALDVWAQSLSDDTAGFIWTKALFWNRVTRGAELPGYTVTNRSTVYFHFNRYLDGLSPEEFWNDDRFDLLPHQAFISTRQQEAWWLQILELLREGRERGALDRLIDNPFGDRVWSPALYTALTRVLSYRAHGDLNPGKWFPPDTLQASTNRHSFLNQLEDVAKKKRVMRGLYEIPEDLTALLKTRESVGAVLLAGGWFKAGLDLSEIDTWSKDFPTWMPYAVTQAKRLVVGEDEALEFAMRQPSSAALTLLIGEMQLAIGRADSGRAALTRIAALRSPIGHRAATLLASLLIQTGETDAARGAIAAQALLNDTLLGRELTARLELAERNTNAAVAIYESIVTNSFAAKSFLAVRAFEAKDYDRARELTEQMQLEQPDMMRLRARLEAIRRAESE